MSLKRDYRNNMAQIIELSPSEVASIRAKIYQDILDAETNDVYKSQLGLEVAKISERAYNRKNGS